MKEGDSAKKSTFGRIRGDRPSERPDWSGTASINEGRPFTVITPHGEVREVMACSPALAIVIKCLGVCHRCGDAIWEGEQHKIDRKRGKIPGTWKRTLYCAGCQ